MQADLQEHQLLGQGQTPHLLRMLVSSMEREGAE